MSQPGIKRQGGRGVRIPKSNSMERLDENSVLNDLSTVMKQELYVITGSPRLHEGELSMETAMGDLYRVGSNLNASSSEDSEQDATDQGSPNSDPDQQMEVDRTRLFRR